MIAARARLLRPAVPLVFVVAFAAFAVASASVRAGGETAFETGSDSAAPLEPAPSRRAALTEPAPETARPLGRAPAPAPAKPLVFAAVDGVTGRLAAPPPAAPRPAASRLVADARAADTAVRPAARPGAPAAAVAPPAPPAPAPAAPGGSLAGVGAKLFLGALILVGALWGATRVVRRLPIARFLPNADGPIRITARSHLGPRASLALVEVGSTSLLLAMTGSGIQTLHVWSDAAPLAAPAARPVPAVPGQLRGLQQWLGGRG